MLLSHHVFIWGFFVCSSKGSMGMMFESNAKSVFGSEQNESIQTKLLIIMRQRIVDQSKYETKKKPKASTKLTGFTTTT